MTILLVLSAAAVRARADARSGPVQPAGAGGEQPDLRGVYRAASVGAAAGLCRAARRLPDLDRAAAGARAVRAATGRDPLGGHRRRGRRADARDRGLPGDHVQPEQQRRVQLARRRARRVPWPIRPEEPAITSWRSSWTRAGSAPSGSSASPRRSACSPGCSRAARWPRCCRPRGAGCWARRCWSPARCSGSPRPGRRRASRCTRGPGTASASRRAGWRARAAPA